MVRLAWRAAFDHIIPEADLPPTELDKDRVSELKAAYETSSAANESHIVAVADEESADTVAVAVTRVSPVASQIRYNDDNNSIWSACLPRRLTIPIRQSNR